MSYNPYQNGSSAPLHNSAPCTGRGFLSVPIQAMNHNGPGGQSPYGQPITSGPMQSSSSPMNGPSLSPMGPPPPPAQAFNRPQFIPNSPQMASNSPQIPYPQVSPQMSASMMPPPIRNVGPSAMVACAGPPPSLPFSSNSFGGQPPSSNFHKPQLTPHQFNQPSRPMTVQQQLQYHQQQLQSLGQRPRVPPPPMSQQQFSPTQSTPPPPPPNQRPSPVLPSVSPQSYQVSRKESNSQSPLPNSSHYPGSLNRSTPNHSSAGSTTVIDKNRLQELVTEIDPSEQLDDDVEDMLLQMTDQFVENLVTASAQLAAHRGAPTVEVADVHFILEKNYNMYLPGFGSGPMPNSKRQAHHQTEAHKQRLALIRKTLKKF